MTRPDFDKDVSVKEYLAACVDDNARRNGKLSTVAMIVSVILLLFSVIFSVTQPLYRVPVMDWAVGEAEMKLTVQQMRREYQALEAQYAQQQGEMSPQESKTVGKALKALDKVTSNFSIYNVLRLLDKCTDLAAMEGEVALAEAGELTSTMRTVVVVIGFSFAVPLVLVVLAGMKKKTGLAIAALMVTALPQFLFCGYLLLALSAAVNFAQIALCKAIRKSYELFC